MTETFEFERGSNNIIPIIIEMNDKIQMPNNNVFVCVCECGYDGCVCVYKKGGPWFIGDNLQVGITTIE